MFKFNTKVRVIAAAIILATSMVGSSLLSFGSIGINKIARNDIETKTTFVKSPGIQSSAGFANPPISLEYWATYTSQYSYNWNWTPSNCFTECNWSNHLTVMKISASSNIVTVTHTGIGRQQTFAPCGSISFYCQFQGQSAEHDICLYTANGYTILAQLAFRKDGSNLVIQVKKSDGSWQDAFYGKLSWLENTWYSVVIDYDNVGGYHGLLGNPVNNLDQISLMAHSFNVWINSSLIFRNVTYMTTANVGTMKFIENSPSGNSTGYYDAVDFSWNSMHLNYANFSSLGFSSGAPYVNVVHNITIRSGAVVTVSGAGTILYLDGMIWIQPGGTLNVQQGATLDLLDGNAYRGTFGISCLYPGRQVGYPGVDILCGDTRQQMLNLSSLTVDHATLRCDGLEGCYARFTFNYATVITTLINFHNNGGNLTTPDFQVTSSNITCTSVFQTLYARYNASSFSGASGAMTIITTPVLVLSTGGYSNVTFVSGSVTFSYVKIKGQLVIDRGHKTTIQHCQITAMTCWDDPGATDAWVHVTMSTIGLYSPLLCWGANTWNNHKQLSVEPYSGKYPPRQYSNASSPFYPYEILTYNGSKWIQASNGINADYFTFEATDGNNHVIKSGTQGNTIYFTIPSAFAIGASYATSSSMNTTIQNCSTTATRFLYLGYCNTINTSLSSINDEAPQYQYQYTDCDFYNIKDAVNWASTPFLASDLGPLATANVMLFTGGQAETRFVNCWFPAEFKAYHGAPVEGWDSFGNPPAPGDHYWTTLWDVYEFIDTNFVPTFDMVDSRRCTNINFCMCSNLQFTDLVLLINGPPASKNDFISRKSWYSNPVDAKNPLLQLSSKQMQCQVVVPVPVGYPVLISTDSGTLQVNNTNFFQRLVTSSYCNLTVKKAGFFDCPHSLTFKNVYKLVEDFNSWGNNGTSISGTKMSVTWTQTGSGTKNWFRAVTSSIHPTELSNPFSDGTGAWGHWYKRDTTKTFGANAAFSTASPYKPSATNAYWASFDLKVLAGSGSTPPTTSIQLCQNTGTPPSKPNIYLTFDANGSVDAVTTKNLGIGLTWAYNTTYNVVVKCLSATTFRCSLNGGITWSNIMPCQNAWTGVIKSWYFSTGTTANGVQDFENFATSW